MAIDTTEKYRFWHAFDISPKVKFENQFPDETVILMLRAHPITQIPWIFNTIIFFIFLLLTNIILPHYLTVRQLLFFNIFIFFVILSYAWLNILYWLFNVGIITNIRIIDVDFQSITYKEVTEARLNKVEDITAKSSGYLSSFFNYGNVFIQTAGEEANIEFLNIPDPSEAVKIINDLLPKKI